MRVLIIDAFKRAAAVAKRLQPSTYFKEGRILFTGEAPCRGMSRAKRRRLYRDVVKAAKRLAT